VLRKWKACVNPDSAAMALPTLLANLTAPRKLFREIQSRWDNPVRSTAAMSGRLNNWPRLPYQLGELIHHSPELPKQLRIILKGRQAFTAPHAVALRPLTSNL
jgi:hypothetical protein